MAFTPFAAKNAKIRIGAATVLTAKLWTVEVSADDLETTNFEGGGLHENIAGIRKLTFSIELDDDGAQNTFDLTVTAGTVMASTIKLYLNGVGGPFWLVSYPFIKSVGHRADVKSTMGLTIQGNGTGSFTYPIGAAGSTT